MYQIVRKKLFLLAAGSDFADETFGDVAKEFDSLCEELAGVDDDFTLKWL